MHHASHLVAKARHALAVSLDEFLTLARRLAVLLDTVTKLEKAVVSPSLGLGASAASVGMKIQSEARARAS